MGCTTAKLKIDLNGMDTGKESIEEAKAVAAKLKEINSDCEKFYKILENWETKKEYKDAIEKSDSQTLLSALIEVKEPLVELNQVYVYAEKISETIVEVLKYFFSILEIDSGLSNEEIKNKISENWFLITNLAKTLSIMLKMDHLKSLKSTIQNDLALIKRFVNLRHRNSQDEDQDEECLKQIMHWEYPDEIDDSTISGLTHFYQSATPFITKCSKNVSNVLTENDENSKHDDILQHIPNIFLAAIEAQLLEKEGRLTFAEAMVCSSVMIDRLLPEGVYHKNSQVDVNGILDVLTTNSKECFGDECEFDFTLLLKQLCFWSMHLRDERTPPKIRGRLSFD